MYFFKNYKGEDLTNYVLRSPQIEQILSDEEFLNYILEPENHYCFVWLLAEFQKNTKLSNIFLTNEFLDRIVDDERANDNEINYQRYASESLNENYFGRKI